MAQKRRRTPIDPLTFKIASGLTLLVAATLVPAGYLAATNHYESQLALKREAIRVQGELIRAGLEHDMLRDKRELVPFLVAKYARTPNIRRVMVFDRLGRLRHTSDPHLLGQRFDKSSSPACQVCHAKPPGRRTTSVMVDIDKRRVIRNVIPLTNRKTCHRCHSPAHAINGVLIIDSAVDEAQRHLAAEVRDLAIGIGVVALVLLGGTRLIINRLVLNRLRHLADSTRAIASGDFNRRIAVSGKGALAQLGQEFNAMTDSVSTLMMELKRHREQLENVMNSVDDGLVVMDETFTITAVNRSFARRFNTSQKDLVYKLCCDIRGEPACQRKLSTDGCAAAKCFASGNLQTTFLSRNDPDHGTRQEEVFTSPIFGDDGRVVEVVEVWRDITERKSHEARMAEFHRLASLGMLASGFSHEINTPLGTMLICAEELKSTLNPEQVGEKDLRQARQQTALIRDEILRCRKITQQFLSLSRGQSLKTDLVDLGQTVEAVVPLVEPTAKDAEVQLRVIQRAGATVEANIGTVQQVLLNLLINAIQASPSGEVVTVETLTTDSEIIIRVSDHGPGIAKETQPRIFEPFFSETRGGTGLGLFVSINFARQWGGDIRVASEPGDGAAFEVTFPRCER